MRNRFAMTNNVRQFLHGVEVVNTPVKGRIGNAPFYGPPGTGKTDVGQWYSSSEDVPYIRAKDITSRRSLLANIVSELGEVPAYQSDALFNQIAESLIERPRPIIIDEVDYLVRGGAVEVLRDINDVTNTPVIMMGTENVDKKLRSFRHLYDRFVAIVRFELFTRDEIASLAGEICTVALSDCAIDFIERSSKGKLRLTTTWSSRAEQVAKRMDLATIEAAHLQGYLRG